jgi:transcriptional regulator with XRE-family HTH domain
MCKDLSGKPDPVTDLIAPEESLETPELSVGARLREAREARDMELRDVARKTRQSQDTLAALEAEETDHIPDSILRLQARNYARFLGLPEEEVASAYAEARGSINTEAMPNEVANASALPSRKVLIAGAAIAGVLAVIGGIAMIVSAPSAPSEDQLAISARLAPEFERSADLVDLSLDSNEEFFIRAIEPAWIEVRGSDGTVFRNRQMQANETYYPRTGAGWTITVRDAGAFEWRLGESPAGRIGEADQALYSVSVDTAMNSALEARSAALADVADGAQNRR